MPDPTYPLLSWVMINDASTKETIYDGELPTAGGVYGEVYVSDYKRPIGKYTFELMFAPKWKWEEVRTAHFTRDATYTLVDEEGDEYTGRIEQYSAPKEKGTPLRHITITLVEDPD